ncbi:Bug family tripartite tricarboxylate transporter substrate binding protein [Falsiroseomonas oryzae]|uniref:Bug family tripartite tricarboxylate transporter substrate binding protein n=1 Tax=Falsiroseomonas oryzae TaxID=2766473 RepID=UPI0022EAC02E|nr:tripartite tricarboxylate transporter substrate binding protein [Roseomonas sp. MO-31]
MHRRSLAAVVAAAALPWPGALAQGLPDRPIRLVVPFGAGGATDIISRLLADRMSTILGQRVVVENRQGAAGNIGAEAVARAAPDGTTLLMASNNILAVNPFVFANMPLDPQRDLRPVALVAALAGMVAGSPNLAATNIQELIALARQRPGDLTYASAGVGSTSHMQGELFQMLTGVQLTHVPYRAAAPAMADLSSGRVQLVFDVVPTLMPHVQAGRLRALAMASERSPLMPDLPTMAEQGVAGYDTRGWFGIMAPAATPDAVVATLHAAVERALAEPELVAAFAAQGGEPLRGSVADFAALAERDRERWRQVVRHANITPQ